MKIKKFLSIVGKVKKKLDFYLIFLSIFFIEIIHRNFPFGQWLSGWDNLHPELNIRLNISRAFTAVWQENQGLGHLGGHGHAASLIHSIFIGVLSIFFPVMSLRAIFAFLMLLGGGYGVYFLIQKLFSKFEFKKVASFVGAIFYVINFATVQTFFIPLESFTIFIGILPWLLISLFNYLDSPSKKSFLIFVLISFFFTPIGFIPPLFVVYMIILIAILGSWILSNPSFKRAKKGFLIGLLTILIHGYWLFPSAYFALASADVYLSSANNSLSTQDFNLKSKSYGNFFDVALMKGFVLESKDISLLEENKNTDTYVFEPWIKHFEKTEIRNISLLFFGIMILGLTYSLFKNKDYKNKSLILMFLLAFTALAESTPPFSFLVSLAKKIPIFEQAFRASFTKFSMLYSLAYSALLGVGFGALVKFITGFFKNKKIKKSLLNLSLIIMVFSMVLYAKPLTQGNLFYHRLKTNIPTSYFELFDFFEKQDKGSRIAMFPAHWNWGWNHYDWSYSGSGFLWYGIEQPILERTFDVWSKYNEGYYLEISESLYKKDAAKFLNVLNKYQVSWIILDESVYKAGEQALLYNNELKQILLDLDIELSQKFGQISVYKINGQKDEVSSLISIPKSYKFIDPVSYSYRRVDPIFSKDITYVEKEGGIIYPFINLLSSRSLEDINLYNDTFVINKKLDLTGNYDIFIPSQNTNEKANFDVLALMNDGQLFVTIRQILPELNVSSNLEPIEKTLIFDKGKSDVVLLEINKQIFKISLNKLGTEKENKIGITSLKIGNPVDLAIYDKENYKEIFIDEKLTAAEVEKCWERDGKESSVNKNLFYENGFSMELVAKNASACTSIRLGKIDLSKPGLASMSLEYRSKNGTKPDICFIKEGSNEKCVNANYFNNYRSSPIWENIDDYFSIDDESIYWITFFSGALDYEDESKSIEYKNIDIKFYSYLDKNTLGVGFWDSIYEDKKINVSDLKTLELSLRVNESKKWEPVFEIDPVGRCQVNEDGIVSQKVTPKSVSLYAENGGVACKSVFFGDVDMDSDHLLLVEGKNINGRGAKFYVQNYFNKKIDIEALLNPEDFKNLYWLRGWPGAEKNNYTIGLESRSFVGGKTENEFSAINLYEYPIEFISKIFIKPKNFKEINLDSTPFSFKKYGTYLYLIDGDIRADSLLLLSQGYDEGWAALDLSSTESVLSGFVKSLRANGWQNSFILENDSSQILILYYPQLFSSAGLLILLLLAIYVSKYLFINKKD